MTPVRLKRFQRGANPGIRKAFARDLMAALDRLGVPAGGEFEVRNAHEQTEMAAPEELHWEEVGPPEHMEPCTLCGADTHQRVFAHIDGKWGWFCRHVTYCKKRQFGDADGGTAQAQA